MFKNRLTPSNLGTRLGAGVWVALSAITMPTTADDASHAAMQKFLMLIMIGGLLGLFISVAFAAVIMYYRKWLSVRAHLIAGQMISWVAAAPWWMGLESFAAVRGPTLSPMVISFTLIFGLILAAILWTHLNKDDEPIQFL
jgi:hypothetical protein